MKDNYAFRSSTFMRALLVLLFMAVSIQWGFAQLNLNVSRGTLGTVIEQIKSQSKYQFFYDDKLAALPVENVKVNNASIEDALNVILKGKDISYKVEDNIVYLSEKSAAPQEGNQQGKERTITGVVSDDMGPLIGVNVLIKGTSNGCITDLDGNFTLTTTETNPVIVFSYIGYTTQEIPVKGNAPINVMMAGDTQQLEEVVVTALGIKRSEKALSYNVQQVNTDAITSNKDANFVNSLSGKVAGVNINASSSGVGGVSKVVMRGTKSIMQSSNALYVIDGVPIFSGRGTAGGKEFDSQGSSEPIADINPEDIESMSVLTGAAAAALYGSEAANGAIVITTKKGKEGKVSLTVSSNTEFTNPFVMPSFQNRYGTGTGGVMSTSGAMSWGAPLSAANNYNYSPRDDYFQTGIVGTESISLSTGTEKNQTYASAAAVNSKGIVPNNKYNRYNFTVRNTTTFLDDKMTLDFGASYILQNDQNMTNQGTYNNPLVGAYLFPRSNDWSDISMYERYDAARKIYTQYWPVGDEGMVMQNPYWINYRNLRQNKKDRYMLNAGLSYKILDWLTVSGRVRLDNSNNDYTEKFYASTNTQLTESSSRGLYGITKTQDKQLYADFLVSINKYFGEDWSLQANVGGSFSDIRSDAMKTRGPIADGGDAFGGEPVGLTNYFAIQNLSASKTQRLQEGWREQTQSLFASAELGYKNTYFLTLTGRNDWNSRLVNTDEESFFYPSVGLSAIISEMVDLPRFISYLKVRGSFTEVGAPISRSGLTPGTVTTPIDGGTVKPTYIYPFTDFKAERTRSYEFGLSLRLWNKLSAEVTYYHSNTKNQTFLGNLPEFTGYKQIYLQAGNVENRGWEASLGYNDKLKNGLAFSSTLTFSRNVNRIKEMVDGYHTDLLDDPIQISEVVKDGGRIILRKGGSIHDIYANTFLKKDHQGYVEIKSDGTFELDNSGKPVYLGKTSPDFNMGWNNSLSYKGLGLSFLLNGRFGGVVTSSTEALLDRFGVSKRSAEARDNGGALLPGQGRVDAKTYYQMIGTGGYETSGYYVYSATNIRLQELTLSYTMPNRWFGNVLKDVTVSFIANNPWMLYCEAPFDPELTPSTATYGQGNDYFMQPSVRSFGFGIKFKL